MFSAFGAERIVDCVTSGKHTLFLDDKGRVWGIGEGSHGELGTGNATSSIVPVLMQQHSTYKSHGKYKKSDHLRAVKIGAAPKRSAFLSESGNLFVCGSVCTCDKLQM